MAQTLTKNGTATITEVKKPRIEPTSRWVRVQFNNQVIADSKETLLVRDGHRLAYYFPAEHVKIDWLHSARTGNDGRQYYDVVVDDRSADSGAWSYQDSDGDLAALRGYIAFNWRKMDHWFEEEEEIFVHPRDPYHRVDAIQSSRKIRIVIDGVTVANCQRPVVLFETGLPTRYYLPQDDIRMDLLTTSRAKTDCPYKGTASYWNVNVAGVDYRNIVWGYLEPLAEAQKIEGLLCFFNEKVDVFVDGELEEKPETLWA
ncbi:MAG: DUF427 domain-containing protein [Anaerolineae bacterium]|nr:MAG: DUF427 domain-containing protein [Anaerolineae bacterium]